MYLRWCFVISLQFFCMRCVLLEYWSVCLCGGWVCHAGDKGQVKRNSISATHRYYHSLFLCVDWFHLVQGLFVSVRFSLDQVSKCQSCSFVFFVFRVGVQLESRLLGSFRQETDPLFPNRRNDRTVPCGCLDGAGAVHNLWSWRDFLSLGSLLASAVLSLFWRGIYHLLDLDWNLGPQKHA